MRYILLFLVLFLGCKDCEADVPKVIVSIAPTKFLVEKIGGEHVSCTLFVPPGTSPHSYEPSLRQIVESSNASLWFRIGESFETRVIRALKDKMQIVDLREGLPLLPSSCSCHGSNDIDTHIWLSPHLLKIQAVSIEKELSSLFPENSPVFKDNLADLLVELSALDEEIKEICDNSPRDYFISSHPAFGYFCKEYGFVELPIEIGGKDPTAKQITYLISEAKIKGVDRVIIQPQYSTRGALHIAKELKASVKMLDPYEEKVIENLKSIAHALSE